MLFRTPSKGSDDLKKAAMYYFKGPRKRGPHPSFAEVPEFLTDEI